MSETTAETVELDRSALRPAVAAMLHAAWREPGFCVPNPTTYPHQWLWDSCFHAVVWAELGIGERALAELSNVLASQEPESGFVPHMTYWSEPERATDLWGAPLRSIITQPPMYGHAVARLTAAGLDVDRPTVERAAHGLWHLLDGRPRTPDGLIPIIHPWESGCDDSPRWDDHRQPGRSWAQTKVDLVERLKHTADPVSGGFRVGSVGFNTLVVWNTRQLLVTVPDVRRAGELAAAAEALAVTIAGRWDASLARWVDDGVGPSAAARTVDALLPLLIDPRPEAFDQLADPDAFASPYGPRGVHRAEASYEPDTYWRGAAWPQLTYLLRQAATAAHRPELASSLDRGLVAGATRSGLAEYWNPETGAAGGARPQSWAGLAIVAD